MSTVEKAEVLARHNAVQAEWMAMPFTASKEEVARFKAHYDTMPKSHISLTLNGYSVILNGMPVSADGRTLEQAISLAIRFKIQTDFIWDGRIGQWGVLP